VRSELLWNFLWFSSLCIPSLMKDVRLAARARSLLLTPLIINIRHHHLHTRIHRPLSPDAPPPLVNSLLGNRLLLPIFPRGHRPDKPSISKVILCVDPVGLGLGKIKGRSTIGIRPAMSIAFLVPLVSLPLSTGFLTMT
jgi:hypothetical protein